MACRKASARSRSRSERTINPSRARRETNPRESRLRALAPSVALWIITWLVSAPEEECPVQPEPKHEDRCKGVKPDGVDTARDIVRHVKRQEEGGDQRRTCQQDTGFHPKSPPSTASSIPWRVAPALCTCTLDAHRGGARESLQLT
jgi:hypothetical protein